MYIHVQMYIAVSCLFLHVKLSCVVFSKSIFRSLKEDP